MRRHSPKPWTAALNLKTQPEEMFEYACHEGNHAMFNMLSAARAAEKAAAIHRVDRRSVGSDDPPLLLVDDHATLLVLVHVIPLPSLHDAR